MVKERKESKKIKMLKKLKKLGKFPPEGSFEIGYVPIKTTTLSDGTIIVEDMEIHHIAVVDTSKPVEKKGVRNSLIKRFKSLFSFLRL